MKRIVLKRSVWVVALAAFFAHYWLGPGYGSTTWRSTLESTTLAPGGCKRPQIFGYFIRGESPGVQGALRVAVRDRLKADGLRALPSPDSPHFDVMVIPRQELRTPFYASVEYTIAVRDSAQFDYGCGDYASTEHVRGESVGLLSSDYVDDAAREFLTDRIVTALARIADTKTQSARGP